MDMTRIVNQALIETERFDLRPLRRSDQGLIAHYGGDERVARMTPSIPHPMPPGMAEAYVTRAMQDDRDEDIWAIDGTRVGASELMGVISIHRLDEGQGEVTFWIAPPYWNTGLASEAVQALVAANPLAHKTLFASVFQDNPASARVVINAGFEYLGDAECFSVARDGPVPTWTYALKLG